MLVEIEEYGRYDDAQYDLWASKHPTRSRRSAKHVAGILRYLTRAGRYSDAVCVIDGKVYSDGSPEAAEIIRLAIHHARSATAKMCDLTGQMEWWEEPTHQPGEPGSTRAATKRRRKQLRAKAARKRQRTKGRKKGKR